MHSIKIFFSDIIQAHEHHELNNSSLCSSFRSIIKEMNKNKRIFHLPNFECVLEYFSIECRLKNLRIL